VPTDVVESRRCAPRSRPVAAAGTRGARVAEPLIGGLRDGGAGRAAAGAGWVRPPCGHLLARRRSCRWRHRRPSLGDGARTEAISRCCPRRSSARTSSRSPARRAGALRHPAALPAAWGRDAGAWPNIVTGLDTDPVVFGKGARPWPADARTDTETFSIVADAAPAQAPAGRNLTASVAWGTSVWPPSPSWTRGDQQQTNNKVLRVQKASTDAASYAGTRPCSSPPRSPRRPIPRRRCWANFLSWPNLPEGRGGSGGAAAATSRGGQALPAAAGASSSRVRSAPSSWAGTFAVSVSSRTCQAASPRPRTWRHGTNGVAALVRLHVQA